MSGDKFRVELWELTIGFRSRVATLAIDAALIVAVLCEAIALACVAFDVPRPWQEVLGVVVLTGVAALLALTLVALRKFTIARMKTVEAADTRG
jgi:hypothetical protein